MSRKHRPKKKPYAKTARDSRRGVHRYHRISDTLSMAVPAGRCVSCKSITSCFCDKCNIWCCEKHLSESAGLEVCPKCSDL